MKTKQFFAAGIFACTVSIFSVNLAYGYPWISPYAFSNNNPVRYVDPDGRDVWEINQSGQVNWIEESKEHTMYALDRDGQRTGNSITVNDRSIFDQLAEGRSNYNGNYAITGSHEVGDVFLFAANNTNVEWGLGGYQGQEGRQYVLRTSHNDGYVNTLDIDGFGMENQYFGMHSHPGKNGWEGTRGASGYGDRYSGDMANMSQWYRQANAQGIPLPTQYVYHKQSQNLYQYTPWVPDIYIKHVTNNQGLRFIVPKR